MKWLSSIVLASIGLVAATSATSATSFADGFKSCKVNIVETSTERTLRSHTFDSFDAATTQQPATPLDLSLDTTFKVACTFDSETSPAIHYASLLFTQADNQDASYAVPLRIRKSKGNHALRLEYNLAKASTDLLALSQPPHSLVNSKLVVSSSDISDPKLQLVVPLSSFYFTEDVARVYDQEVREQMSKTPSEWQVEHFAPREPRSWENRVPESGKGIVVGLAGSAVVVGVPVLVLIFLLVNVLQKLPLTSHSFKSSIFMLCLVAFEGLILAYWVKIRLLTVLPMLGALGLVTAYVGKGVLGERQVQRLKAA